MNKAHAYLRGEQQAKHLKAVITGDDYVRGNVATRALLKRFPVLYKSDWEAGLDQRLF
jgi:hypothetical protein